MTTPHPTPLSTLPLIAPNMHAEVQRTIDEHPEIDTHNEDARGAVIDITDWRVNGGVDRPWGRKARSSDPANPNLNTDGMTYLRSDGLFEIYDCIDGTSGQASWSGYGPYAPGENGWWHPPMPVADQPVPVPDLDARVTALEGDVALLSDSVVQLQAAHEQLAEQVADLIADLAGGLHAHGPINLPIVLESLTSLRCIGDIDVAVKPGQATPPQAASDDPPNAASLLLLRRLLARPDEPEPAP